jgi:hypothetical protein
VAFDGCETCYHYASAVIESARLDWTGALEQIVVGVNALDADLVQRSEVWILTFDGSDQLIYEIPTVKVVEPVGGTCQSGMRGLAIGNLNRHDEQGSAPSFPSSLDIVVLQGFNLGSAVGGTVCSSGPNIKVDVYAIDPSNWSIDGPVEGGPSTFTEQASAQQPTYSMVAGDFQGGSLVVGPPSVVPLEGLVEPEIVVQAPPMHMDFVLPVDASSADLLNLSFGLPGFNTKFTESSGTTTSTSHQSTTSNTFAEKESLETSLSFGVPLVASVSVSLKETAEQTQQEVVAKNATTITSTVDSFSAASDLDDLLWYSQQDLDIYIYPVLCPPDPSDSSKCGTSPSDVMFSVPQKQTLYSAVPGSQIEWYQPPHQVALALSYPWTKSQLEALPDGHSRHQARGRQSAGGRAPRHHVPVDRGRRDHEIDRQDPHLLVRHLDIDLD